MSLPNKPLPDFHKIIEELQDQLKNIRTIEDLLSLKMDFLGKSGVVTELVQSVKSFSFDEKKKFADKIYELRDSCIGLFNNKKAEIEDMELSAKLYNDAIDITLPSRGSFIGGNNLITRGIAELELIFSAMGYKRVYGQEMEDDWHNFTALNISPEHPARDEHDTFYIKQCNAVLSKPNTEDRGTENTSNNASDFKYTKYTTDPHKMLLRTHTSSVQIRYMMESGNKPPFKIISIGKVYRADYDATHTPMFHQMECLYVDENVNFSHLKGMLETFLAAFFGHDNITMRLRPSYFPFTQPSAEVDIMQVVNGERKWIEVLGCGIVHKNVLRNVGIDTTKYKGYAFGVGIERLLMIKYGINDIRCLFDSDIRMLRSVSLS